MTRARGRSRPWRCRPLAVAAALLLSGCASLVNPPPSTPTGSHRPAVVIVSVDGLRPDAIHAAGARNLQRLIAEGAYSPAARTVLPSKTLPSHTSMLTGFDVPTHGIDWNDDRTDELGVVQVPTVFEVASEHGLSTAAIFGKSKFRHLIRPESLDWASVLRGPEIRLAAQVVEEAEMVIRFRRPDLLFVHLADPDLAGHAFGWMSWPYRAAVRRADAGIERVRRAARQAYGDEFVLIVTADHGGEGRGHGAGEAPDRLIPWLAWGEPVRSGRIGGSIDTFDTAATIVWLLGLPVPDAWDGRPVTEAFAAPGSGG